MVFKVFLPLFLSFFLMGHSSEQMDRLDGASQLLSDLELVYQIDKKIHDELPLFYNFSVMGGYYNMPSARMNSEGTVSLGASFPPPYNIYGLNVQPFDRLELSVNYLIYNGILEPGFGKEGFGDDAERMGNIKFGVLTPSEDIPFLPMISIGAQDFIGTKRFNAQYVVATKSWLDANFECTLGWGHGRIKGFFGGASWTPFRHSKNFFKNLTLQAEYDANDYKNNLGEHAKGRSVKSRINGGISLLAFDTLQLSVSSVRGEKVAASASLRYPLGTSKGFFPKVDDPKISQFGVDTEATGLNRPESTFANELAYAFADQGIDLYSVFLEIKNLKKELWIKVVNNRYRDQTIVKERIEAVLAALVPSDIEAVTVVIDSTAIPCQSFRFRVEDLYKYRLGIIGSFELEALSPIREAGVTPTLYEAIPLFKRSQPIWTFTARPRIISFFGNTSGKFKYNISAIASPEGYLFSDFYYKGQVSYSAFANTAGMSGVDRLNPSHMFVVRSDSMKYYQSNTLHLEQAFLQRAWNLGKGCFYRLSAGYFEVAYAGAATEFLYYPVASSFAMGLEFATVWKRHYEGLGFFYKVRKYDGTKVRYVPFTGYQAFLNLYYDFKPLAVDCKLSLGQFLATDKGGRLELGKYFANGVRFSLWYAITTANEELNGHRYHDKGFAFLVPLDMFMKQSSRSYVGYAMAAWLRDQAATADTGKRLYPTLREERFCY